MPAVVTVSERAEEAAEHEIPVGGARLTLELQVKVRTAPLPRPRAHDPQPHGTGPDFFPSTLGPQVGATLDVRKRGVDESRFDHLDQLRPLTKDREGEIVEVKRYIPLIVLGLRWGMGLLRRKYVPPISQGGTVLHFCEVWKSAQEGVRVV
jgi:hypothetical protein